jgi:hypothetical protein
VLSADLAKGNVTVNASPPDTGPGLLVSLLVGFRLLLIAAFVWLTRRAGSIMSGGPLLLGGAGDGQDAAGPGGRGRGAHATPTRCSPSCARGSMNGSAAHEGRRRAWR